MRTLWADSLDSDREQLSSAHLLGRRPIHIQDTLPPAACDSRATSWSSLFYTIDYKVRSPVKLF
jgi:hypothetical protein